MADQGKPSHQSIILPTIHQRQGTEQLHQTGGPELVSSRENVASTTMKKTDVSSRSSKGYLTAQPPTATRTKMAGISSDVRRSKRLLHGRSARNARANTNRPVIHIRDGKLMISGNVPRGQQSIAH